MAQSSACLFRHRLPLSRLGYCCGSYPEFVERCQRTVNGKPSSTTTAKQYSLVVVTDETTTTHPKQQKRRRCRILLGLKQRGFGAGMYNSFGGKLEHDETALASAKRELREETGILAPLEALHQVGDLRFSFADSEKDMWVHLFRVRVSYNAEDCSGDNDGDQGNPPMVLLEPGKNDVLLEEGQCSDEITPYWFEDWHNIPLHNMFADDSLWLTRLLSASTTLPKFNGWFHFEAGGADVNTIRHYYLTGIANQENVAQGR